MIQPRVNTILEFLGEGGTDSLVPAGHQATAVFSGLAGPSRARHKRKSQTAGKQDSGHVSHFHHVT